MPNSCRRPPASGQHTSPQLGAVIFTIDTAGGRVLFKKPDASVSAAPLPEPSPPVPLSRMRERGNWIPQTTYDIGNVLPSCHFIRDAHELQSLAFKDSRPRFVVSRRGRIDVVGTIHFEHKSQFMAIEVDDEATDHMLPAKLKAMQPSIAEDTP